MMRYNFDLFWGYEWSGHLQCLGGRSGHPQHLLRPGDRHGWAWTCWTTNKWNARDLIDDSRTDLDQIKCFRQILFSELERSIRMGPVEFFSSLGGIFGLCLGFSIISFIEVTFQLLWIIFSLSFIFSPCWMSSFVVQVVYWGVIRMCRNFGGRHWDKSMWLKK